MSLRLPARFVSWGLSALVVVGSGGIASLCNAADKPAPGKPAAAAPVAEKPSPTQASTDALLKIDGDYNDSLDEKKNKFDTQAAKQAAEKAATAKMRSDLEATTLTISFEIANVRLDGKGAMLFLRSPNEDIAWTDHLWLRMSEKEAAAIKKGDILTLVGKSPFAPKTPQKASVPTGFVGRS